MFITILCIAAVYRLTYMIQSEKGPWAIFEKFRQLFVNKNNEPNGLIGEGLQCLFCLSIWCSIPFALYLSPDVWQFPIYLLALSAGAIIISELIDYLR